MSNGTGPLRPGRRRALGWLGALAASASSAVSAAPVHGSPAGADSRAVARFAEVVPHYSLRFPQDEGSHPEFRIEWWYITGWLESAGNELGFQVTFFRARPQRTDDNPSAFAPRQLLAAHAAVSDAAEGKLMHAQRAARAGFGLAGADSGRTRVWIDDWLLEQDGRRYTARISTRRFSFDLLLERTQPPLLHGAEGYSRKGPEPRSASYYYTHPHLRVSGTLVRSEKRQAVSGTAWMDHEWSSQYMDERADGWDWIGLNLEDGSALMAFRMRAKDGGTLWAGGTHRRADGSVQIFTPEEIRFAPRRHWRSPRTGAVYPVSFTVQAGDMILAIEPLMDDQESDARASTGTIYWEGAVRALRGDRAFGRGYLELTGYWRPLDI